MGENFDDYYARLTDVVDTIFGKTLKSDGELISAVYFAVSAGSTEASADIWVENAAICSRSQVAWTPMRRRAIRTKVRLTSPTFKNVPFRLSGCGSGRRK